MGDTRNKEARLTVVTGGSRGLGEALVRAFAPHSRVLAVARDFPSDFQVPEGVELLRADLTSPVGAVQVGRGVGERKVDVLIHNAGILGPRVPIAEYPEEAWDAVLKLNLTAVFRLTKALLPLMREPGGCILHVGSGAGRRVAPQWGAYAVSKFGIDALSMLLAEELKPRGIRVHSINPVGMRTAMRAAAHPQEDPATLPAPAEVAPYFVTVASAAAEEYPVILDAPRP